MKLIDSLDGHDLNQAVVSNIFKHQIIGKTTCAYIEGGWSIYPNTKAESWMCHADERGVYVDSCFCDDRRDDEYYSTLPEKERQELIENHLKYDYFAGHHTICLAVVDDYNSDIKLAMEVIEDITPKSFTMHHIDNLWIVELKDEINEYKSNAIGPVDDHNVAATVISRAALKYVLKSETIEESSYEVKDGTKMTH